MLTKARIVFSPISQNGAFQGRSKVLDHREELLKLLGATSGQFTEAPIQLLLAPPHWNPTGSDDGSGSAFKDVLFIENLVTFEHMADTRASAWVGSLLVYAAGFRGSARRLRSRAGCRLYLRAPVSTTSLPAIENWLFQPLADERDGSRVVPVCFFGDLDHAGMQILAFASRKIPQCAKRGHWPQTLRSRHSVVQPEHHSEVDFYRWPVPRSSLFPSERPAPAPKRRHDMPPNFPCAQWKNQPPLTREAHRIETHN